MNINSTINMYVSMFIVEDFCVYIQGYKYLVQLISYFIYQK